MIILPNELLQKLDEKDIQKIQEILTKKMDREYFNQQYYKETNMTYIRHNMDFDLLRFISYPEQYGSSLKDLLYLYQQNIEKDQIIKELREKSKELDKIKEVAKLLKGIE